MSWWFSNISLLLLVFCLRGKAEDASPPKKWAFFDPMLDAYDVEGLQTNKIESAALRAVLQSLAFANELWLRQERIKGLNHTHATFLVDTIASQDNGQTTVENTFELSKLDGTDYGKEAWWPEGFAQAIKKVKGSDPVTVPEALKMLTGQEPVNLYKSTNPQTVTKDNFYLQILHSTKFLRKPLVLQIREKSKAKYPQAGWPYAVISFTADSLWLMDADTALAVSHVTDVVFEDINEIWTVKNELVT